MQFNESKLIVAQSLSFIFLCFSHLTCFLCYFLLADNTPYFKFMIHFKCLVMSGKSFDYYKCVGFGNMYVIF